MTKLIKLAIVIFLLCEYSECCDSLKYRHTLSGKADLYEKLNKKSCNGQPIYKMVDDRYFIYKLADSEFWCNSYLPSNIVICQAECDEVRFDFQGVFTKQGAIPLEYAAQYSDWIPLLNQAILCNDEDYLEEVVVVNSTDSEYQFEYIGEVNNVSLLNETATLNKTRETLLDQVINSVKKWQNESIADLQNRTEILARKTTEQLQDDLHNSENAYILMKLMEKTEEMRMKQIRDEIIIKTHIETLETTTQESHVNDSTTISQLNKDDPDEDKYILSMVLQFSEIGKNSDDFEKTLIKNDNE